MERIKNLKLTTSAIALATLATLAPLTSQANALDVNDQETISYEEEWDLERKISGIAFATLTASLLAFDAYLGTVGSKYADQEQREARRLAREAEELPRVRIITARPIMPTITQEIRQMVDYSEEETKSNDNNQVLKNRINTNVRIPERSLVYRNIPMKENARAFRR